jgi:predicted metal-dependent phosphoesterase TrpH
MPEIIVNLHMHTRYSDGAGSHTDIANAAMNAGIDAVIVTDHNVWVKGPAGYYKDGKRRVLLMVGEEIHDQARQPQKNHLLVFGVNRELATSAYDPQALLDAVANAGGISFLAHPVECAAPAVNEGDISWVDWDVHGFTGLEIWNGFSEIKARIQTKLHAIYYVFLPRRIARGPEPQALRIWNELHISGKKVVAIGGSDAHSNRASLGPLRRTVLPYEFHFNAINTHVLLPQELGTDAEIDTGKVLEALRQGHCFVGYDLPASTRGFSFSAHGYQQIAQMGDELECKGGVTITIRLPRRTECVLLKNGKPVRTWQNHDLCTHITSEPGVYRVEAYIHYLGRRRGWIYSNPVYVH